MEPLERVESADSVRSRASSHHLSAASPALNRRKSRFADAQTDSGDVERASISMPPPNSKLGPRQFSSQRRLSRTLDLGLQDTTNKMKSTSAIDDSEGTPTLDGARKGNVSPTASLPDPVFLAPRSEPDLESNRMSFSSLYTYGSALYDRARGAMISAPSSVADSEPESELVC